MLAQAQDINMTGTVVTTDTDIGSARLDKGVEIGVFEVLNNSATKALNNFEVWVKAHASGSWRLLVSDFTTEDSVMLCCPVAVDTLAAGAASILMLRTGPIDAIKFVASTSSGGAAAASVTVRGRMQ